MLRVFGSAKRIGSWSLPPHGYISSSLNGLAIGVPKETLPGEARVGLTPTHVAKLTKQGAKIQVQAGAGLGSGFSDASFKEAGAEIVDEKTIWKSTLITKAITLVPTFHITIAHLLPFLCFFLSF